MNGARDTHDGIASMRRFLASLPWRVVQVLTLAQGAPLSFEQLRRRLEIASSPGDPDLAKLRRTLSELERRGCLRSDGDVFQLDPQWVAQVNSNLCWIAQAFIAQWPAVSPAAVREHAEEQTV